MNTVTVMTPLKDLMPEGETIDINPRDFGHPVSKIGMLLSLAERGIQI